MIQTIKLAKLVASDINVRKTIEPVEQLAADIASRGILQNLVVTSVRKPRGGFAVIAGGRRLRALQLLVSRGTIDLQYDVPVLVLAGDDEVLTEASLAENFQHLAMNPADECRAFQHFLINTDDVDGVAKRFGVTRRFIEGRLRLAKLAEPIFAALSAGEITLDIAKAYASTESHDKQLMVWGQYSRSSHTNADAIRRVIASEALSSNDPVALLVGADAYVLAGGIIDRDLFSDNADRWLSPEIAQNLASAIMEAEAKRIGDETGLAWIRPVAGPSTWDMTRDLFRVHLPKVPMSKDDEDRLDQITARIDDIADEMNDESLSEDHYNALALEVDHLEAERARISQRAQVIPPELAGRVGKFITLTRTGRMELDDSYYSETPLRITMLEDVSAAGDHVPDCDDNGNTEASTAGTTSTKPMSGDRPGDDQDAAGQPATPNGGRVTFLIEDDERSSGGAGVTGGKSATVDPDNAAPGGKALSQVLADQLAMQRRDVLAASIIANPALALDYMLFAMVDQLSTRIGSTGTTISASRPQDPVLSNAMPASRTRDYLGQVHEGLDDSWSSSSDIVARFEAFRILGDDSKAAWLAYVVATSFIAKESYSSHKQNPLQNRLATILEIDVATWWRPTSENFFDRVSKTALLSLLNEVGGPALSGRHATQKKSEISPACEKLFAGEAIVEPEVRDAALTWVPTAMRFNDRAGAAKDQDEAGVHGWDSEDNAADLDDLTKIYDETDPGEGDGGDDAGAGEFADGRDTLDANDFIDGQANDDEYGDLEAAE